VVRHFGVLVIRYQTAEDESRDRLEPFRFDVLPPALSPVRPALSAVDLDGNRTGCSERFGDFGFVVVLSLKLIAIELVDFQAIDPSRDDWRIADDADASGIHSLTFHALSHSSLVQVGVTGFAGSVAFANNFTSLPSFSSPKMS